MSSLSYTDANSAASSSSPRADSDVENGLDGPSSLPADLNTVPGLAVSDPGSSTEALRHSAPGSLSSHMLGLTDLLFMPDSSYDFIRDVVSSDNISGHIYEEIMSNGGSELDDIQVGLIPIIHIQF